jgi:nucleoside-diphosphate-sugar epimerase
MNSIRAEVPRRAIIFGASGFIGTHLTAYLAHHGTEVIAADIVEPRAAFPAAAQFIFCDVRNEITISCDERFDAVFNLAAVHRTPGHQPHEYYETNVGGAVNLVNWLEKWGLEQLTFTSSISVYGPSESLKSEATPPEPASDYGRSKWLAEELFRAVVYGPGEDGNFTRLARALRDGRFLYPGRKDTIKSGGYVTDLVRALLFGMAAGPRDVLFNYCYPTRSTIEEICTAFTEVAGYQLPRAIPPALVGGVIRGLRTINPTDRGNVNAARVEKLVTSTNIAADALQRMGFEWETDLITGLRAWHEVSELFV